MSATATARAPRGTKILAQAFFTAADAVPDAQRDGVVKAALALIREQLKDARDKAKVAKEKLKAKGAKGPATRKAGGRPKAAVKTAARRGRKAAATLPDESKPEGDDE
jgi:hypothetical protein